MDPRADEPMRGRRPVCLLALVLLVAFFLRAYGLGSQSLWHDEGLSVGIAQQGWDVILRGGGEYHPPLYHLLLGGWVRLAGAGEYSARYLSLICGVVTVALGERLGSLLVGRRAGVLTALLLAVSPIEVWYAQEARMYALLGVLTLASSLCLLRLIYGKGGRRLWAHYALLNIAAIYSHYYGALILAAQAVWVLLYTVRWRAWRFARAWAMAQAGLGVALLPWLPSFRQQFYGQDASYWPGEISAMQLARSTWLGFAGGGLMVPEQAALQLARLAAGLAVVGLIAGLARVQSRPGTALLAIYVLAPFALLYAIVHTRPKYSPRYVLTIVPPYLTLAAAGAAALWPALLRRRPAWLRMALAAVLTGGLAAGSALAATHPLRDARFGRDDMRGAAAYLAETVGEDEAVILLSGHFLPVFSRYYNRLNCYPIPPEPTPAPDVNNVLGLKALEHLNRALDGRRGAWLVLWQNDVVDPNGLIAGLLDAVATEEPVARSFRGLALRHYTFPPGTQVSREMLGRRPRDLTVAEGGIKLLSAGLPPAQAGGKATFFVTWEALRPLSLGYHASWRLFDAQGQERARHDTPLAGATYQTQRWQPGRVVVASHALQLPADLPPGDYTLKAWVYPLGSTSADVISLGCMQVERSARQATAEEIGIAQPLGKRLGDLELLAYHIEPAQPADGSPVHLTLSWRVLACPARGERTAVYLGDRRWSTPSLPPLLEMQPGDIFTVRYRLTTLPGPAGDAQPLAIALEDAQGQAVTERLDLCRLPARIRERVFALPAAIAHPQRATLGRVATFLGYDLGGGAVRPGDVLPVTLYWQAMQSQAESYTVFVHLIDAQGRIWGQVDSIPLQGARPTSDWLPSEVLVDPYALPVRSDAPPGTYMLEVGLYDVVTGVRLPVRDEHGRPMPDDRILLAAVELRAP